VTQIHALLVKLPTLEEDDEAEFKHVRRSVSDDLLPFDDSPMPRNPLNSAPLMGNALIPITMNIGKVRVLESGSVPTPIL
jgi:hypothetical protein